MSKNLKARKLHHSPRLTESERVKHKNRNCLNCSTEFESSHSGNRICYPCKDLVKFRNAGNEGHESPVLFEGTR